MLRSSFQFFLEYSIFPQRLKKKEKFFLKKNGEKQGKEEEGEGVEEEGLMRPYACNWIG